MSCRCNWQVGWVLGVSYEGLVRGGRGRVKMLG